MRYRTKIVIQVPDYLVANIQIRAFIMFSFFTQSSLSKKGVGIVFILSTLFIAGQAAAQSITYRSVDGQLASKNELMTKVHHKYLEYRNVYMKFVGLSSVVARYEYEKAFPSQNLYSVARASVNWPRTSEWDMVLSSDLYLDYEGELKPGTESFNRAVMKATGNLHVECRFGRSLARELKKTRDAFVKALIELAQKHSIELYTGEYQTSFTGKEFAILIDTEINQLLLLEAGYVE